MTDQEILDKYTDCLTEKEKKQVMEMLYKYKEMFSLRGEIGTCPNIEVEIDVTDKSPFLLGHIMLKKKKRLSLTKK